MRPLVLLIAACVVLLAACAGTARPPDAANIKKQIEQRLLERGFDRLMVAVTPDGVVTLTGLVENQDRAQEAIALAQVPGVKEVRLRRPATANGQPRETGWALLASGQSEDEGYGLYSYFLFGFPPTADTRDRYLAAIRAYLEGMPDVKSLERSIPRRELNVLYLLTVEPAPSRVSADWILEHYDYARARALLRVIPEGGRDGPYIVSSLRPVRADTMVSGPYLFQNLSVAPPRLVPAWVKEFLDQAARERFWEERTMQQLALRMRTGLAILAEGLPEIRRALDDWIKFAR